MVRFEPNPAGQGRAVLPSGWSPPVPFEVRIYYWDPARPVTVLWVMPYVRFPSGLVGFTAVGPAGQPFDGAAVRYIDKSQVPPWAVLHVQTDFNTAGRRVYGQLNHTLN